jgi:hypothetical protein
MKLLLVTLLLSLTVVAFCVSLVWARNPMKPRWYKDFLFENVLALAVIMLFVTGTGAFVQFAADSGRSVPDLTEIVLSALLVLASIVSIKALRVRKRLAAYAALEKAQAAQRPEGPDDGRPAAPSGTDRKRLAA